MLGKHSSPIVISVIFPLNAFQLYLGEVNFNWLRAPLWKGSKLRSESVRFILRKKLGLRSIHHSLGFTWYRTWRNLVANREGAPYIKAKLACPD